MTDLSNPIFLQAINRLKAKKDSELPTIDPVQWIEHQFYIPELRAPMKLAPYQRRALREALSIGKDGLFKYSTIVWGEIKKSAKCIHPDTEFNRPDGSIVKAKDLVKGDSVLSMRQDGTLLFSEVGEVEKQKPTDGLKIITSRGREIIVTNEHPFLVYGDLRPPATMKQSPLKPKYKWLPASWLVKGDRLVVGLDWVKEDKPVDELDLYLLGAYIGDGGAGKITTMEPEMVDAFSERFEFGHVDTKLLPSGRESKASTYKLLKVNDWLKRYKLASWDGKKTIYSGSHDKVVPYQVFASGRRGILSFLAGYLDTDGYVSHLVRSQPSMAWTSVNRDLLSQCQILLASIGYNANLIDRWSKYKGEPYRHYELVLYGREQVEKISTELPLRVAHKREKLLAWAELHREENGWVNDLYSYDKVESIEPIPNLESIGVEIPETHVHITNGLVTHNTSISAGVMDWLLANMPYSSGKFVANSLDQADSRASKMLRTNFSLHPRQGVEVIPSRNLVRYPNNSEVKSIPINPSAEAGGNDSIVAFDELWGAHEQAKETMWTEMTLSPTRFGKSFRWVSTYAGYLGESNLLWSLYQQGVDEYAQYPGEGKRFDWCDEFDPPLECYHNDAARLFCLWNTVPRLSWQTPEYYAQESSILVPSEFNRVHRNQWSAAVEAFVPIEWWDACRVSELPPLDPTEPIIVGIDAAVSQDCFGIIAVSRHGDKVAVRYIGEWKPPRGGKIEFVNLNDPDDINYPEGVCRHLYRTNNVLEFAYDQTHLAEMTTRLQRGGFGFYKVFSQGRDRLVSDKILYDMIARKGIMHNGDPRLRAHIQNANAELKGDKSMRLVKRAPNLHIDLAVSLSMATQRIMHYRLG